MHGLIEFPRQRRLRQRLGQQAAAFAPGGLRVVLQRGGQMDAQGEEVRVHRVKTQPGAGVFLALAPDGRLDVEHPVAFGKLAENVVRTLPLPARSRARDRAR